MRQDSGRTKILVRHIFWCVRKFGRTKTLVCENYFRTKIFFGASRFWRTKTFVCHNYFKVRVYNCNYVRWVYVLCILCKIYESTCRIFPNNSPRGLLSMWTLLSVQSDRPIISPLNHSSTDHFYMYIIAIRDPTVQIKPTNPLTAVSNPPKPY